MRTECIAVLIMGLALSGGWAGEKSYPKAKVSFDDYKGLVAEVEPYRASRLVDLNTFLKMSKEESTIILDSRSDFRFERLHVKGAKHLAFTDFTEATLKRLIPDPNTRILIYCNNNFDGNQVDFASKTVGVPLRSAVPPMMRGESEKSQLAAQAKPLMMALNIPTYVNLYGYGYRNVYELDELVKVTDPRIEFEGSTVGKSVPPILPIPVK